MRDRRQFLGVAGLAGLGLAADASTASAATHAAVPNRTDAPTQPAPSRRTVLAIGAHYDDCPFGIPGVLLQAAAAGHRVVTLSLIGDYTNWKPVAGRAEALVEGTRRISAEYGAEARFLSYASGRVPVTDESVRAVAEVVAELQPDVAFVLWERDQHPDHEAASQVAQTALRLGDRLLPDPMAPFRAPSRIYYFDNGPRHTIGFEPDTFVDVTAQWDRSAEWLGRLMALVRDAPYDPTATDSSVRLRETLVRYRGATCGVACAEAFAAANAYPQVIF